MRLVGVLLLVPGMALARPTKVDAPAVARELAEAALASREAFEELRVLCDTIGHRISGSPQLARAVTWGAAELAADGLEVELEPVTVPVWNRGLAHAEIVAPWREPLPLLALGGSVATPPGGLEADVLVVTSFDDLTARGPGAAAGKVVVWDVPFTTYGETVGYRVHGATRAAEAGAVASLVRSVSPTSLRSPHTGMQRYGDGVARVPTAAIALEDAARFRRWQAAGTPIRVHLDLRPSDGGTAESHNVVGTLRGRSKPAEVVELGCHLDSWDVGQGAQDDGAGCVTVMEAAALIAALPTPPRRTIRVVLFTNEESGLAGALEHARRRAGERIVAAIEDDTGSGAPRGFRVEVPGDDVAADKQAVRELEEALAPYRALLQEVGAGTLTHGFSGADVGPLVKQGTLGFGLDHDETGYWPVHHTEADTFDKVDPELVRRNVAAVALLAWALAEHDGPIPGSRR